MGRNGAGKSTLLAALAGLVRPVGRDGPRGRRRPGGAARPRPGATGSAWCRRSRATCSTPTRVGAECAAGRPRRRRPGRDGRARCSAGCRRPLDPARHPRDLSEGQRLALALAVVLAGRPPLLLLDEPTRGLDYPAKDRLVGRAARPGRGRARRRARHPRRRAGRAGEPTAPWCSPTARWSRTGRPARWSPVAVFAPQVAKVLAPLPWLTVAEVAAASSRAGRRDRGAARRRGPALRLRPRALAAVVAVTLVGVGGVQLAVRLAGCPARVVAQPVATRRGCSCCCCRCCSASCSPRSPTAGMDAKAVALLGVLAGRRRGAAPARRRGRPAFEPVFFLLVPAGRVLGRGFGFVLGSMSPCSRRRCSPAASARGCRSRCWPPAGSACSPGCLPRARGRAEVRAAGRRTALLAGLRLRLRAQPVVLAVRDDRPRAAAGRLRARRADRRRTCAAGWPSPSPPRLGFDIPRGLLTARPCCWPAGRCCSRCGAPPDARPSEAARFDAVAGHDAGDS